MRAPPANFTQLLTEWRFGSSAGAGAPDRRWVYDEITAPRLATTCAASAGQATPLQATAVVHEAFLRLIQANVPAAG